MEAIEREYEAVRRELAFELNKIAVRRQQGVRGEQ